MAKKRRQHGPTQVYAFVDTNIFLDFYRANNETNLRLLKKIEDVRSRIISTYQVEMEFLKNRQKVLLGALKEIKNPTPPPLPAIIADTATSQSLRESAALTEKKTDLIRKRIIKLFKDPKNNDIVYQTLKSVFNSESPHVLTRDMQVRQQIKRLAWRRFVLGYPPRKQTDTSIGDALNWEWIVHCGNKLTGRIVIVSRDSDYGCTVKDEYFLNDQLSREYRERVGRKSIRYTRKLTDALKELNVDISPEEENAEADAIKADRKRKYRRAVSQEEFRVMVQRLKAKLAGNT